MIKRYKTSLTSLFLFCISFIVAEAQHFTGPIDQGVLSDAAIDEASGLCASKKNALILWTHNDSGDLPRIFAVTNAAKVVGTYYVKGVENRDWEDICSAEIDGQHFILVGDIGDNNAQYATKTIYKIPEPAVDFFTQTAIVDTLTGSEAIVFQYPDGPRDAECLMFDSRSRDIYVLSKREDSVRLYRLPYPQSTSSTITASYEETLPFTSITGGDISADGSEILIRDYEHIYYFKRSATQSIAEALKGLATEEPYKMEPQGEAVCFEASSSGYYTISENSPLKILPHLYFYARVQTGIQSSEKATNIRIDSVHPDNEGRNIIVYFDAQEQQMLSVQLCDLKGHSINSSQHETHSSGRQELRLRTQGLASGQYTVRLINNREVVQKSFTFVR